MNDLIKRKDVIRVVNAYDDTVYALQAVQQITDGIAKIIKALPSADRPQGEWIEVDDSLISCKCSICGWESHMHEDDVYGMPYCPNCGAKMKGVGDETAIS